MRFSHCQANQYSADSGRRALLHVLSGMPVVHGIPIGDVRAASPMPIPATPDKKAVGPHHSKSHPHSYIVYHAGVFLLLFRRQ